MGLYEQAPGLVVKEQSKVQEKTVGVCCECACEDYTGVHECACVCLCVSVCLIICVYVAKVPSLERCKQC